MPDRSGSTRPELSLVADLHVEVGDERGSTTARLSGDGDGLVLDVSDPRTLLRCLPSQTWPGLRPAPAVTRQFAGVPVQITSQGRPLGRVSVTERGRLRVRPTWSGARTVAGHPTARLLVGAVGAFAVAAAVVIARRRTR